MSGNDVAIFKFYSKRGVWQCVNHSALHFNGFFFWHVVNFLKINTLAIKLGNYSRFSKKRPLMAHLERKISSKCSHTLCMLRFFVDFSFNLGSFLGVFMQFR